MVEPGMFSAGTALRQRVAARGLTWCDLSSGASSSQRFLDDQAVAPAWKMLLHHFLRFWMSHYDANALLNIYQLHLLAPEQFSALLSAAGAPPRFGRALDVGSGDGSCAASLLVPRSDYVACTETSDEMAKQVEARGITCFRVDLADAAATPGKVAELDAPFDIALLFNVLDRTARPRTLLREVSSRLRAGGTLVVAIPLPFQPHWFDGAKRRLPIESLDQSLCERDEGSTAVDHGSEPIAAKGGGEAGGSETGVADEARDAWDAEAARFLFDVLPRLEKECAFKVKAISRVPYLSAGDVLRQQFYFNHDLCVVCQKS